MINFTDDDWITLDLYQFESWWLFLHHPNDIPPSSNWNAIEMVNGHQYAASFTLNSYSLLKTPYRTDCKHYPKETKHSSRRECIRMCKLNLSMKQCGVIAYNVDIYRNESVGRFAQTHEEVNCIKQLDLKRKCHQMCPHNDCFKQYIVPKIISQGAWNGSYSNLELAFPNAPMTMYYQRPAIEYIEFLCYLASIFSLWFGFSLLSIYDWILVIYSQTTQKKAQQTEIAQDVL